jgi:DNA invertase Pin-like site-specific DNA recombinase
MIYGYAPVSTDGQSVDAQIRQLRVAGAGKVFREVASGAKIDRAQLRRLLSEVVHGDVVTVTRIDRHSLFHHQINELLSSSSTPLPARLLVTFLSVRICDFSIRERHRFYP